MEVEQPLILQTLLTSDEESDLLKSPDRHMMSTSGPPSPTNIEIAIEHTSNFSFKPDSPRTLNGEMRDSIAFDVRELSDRLAESVSEVFVHDQPFSTKTANSVSGSDDICDLKKLDSTDNLVLINKGENYDEICVSEISQSAERNPSDLASKSVQEEMDVEETVLDDNVAISETLVDDELLENEILDDNITSSDALSLQTDNGATAEVETQDVLPSKESSLLADVEDIKMPHNAVDSKTRSMHVDDELFVQNCVPEGVTDDTESKLVRDLSPLNSPSLPIINGEVDENVAEESEFIAISTVSVLEEDAPKTTEIEMEENCLLDEPHFAPDDVSSSGVVDHQDDESWNDEIVLNIEEGPPEEANVKTDSQQSESVAEICDGTDEDGLPAGKDDSNKHSELTPGMKSEEHFGADVDINLDEQSDVLSASAVEVLNDDASGNLEEKCESDEHPGQPPPPAKSKSKDESQSLEEGSSIAIPSSESVTSEDCESQERLEEHFDKESTVEHSGTVETTDDGITDNEARLVEGPMDSSLVPNLLGVEDGSDMNNIQDSFLKTFNGRVAETIGKKRRSSAPPNEICRAAKIAKGRSSLTDLDEVTENEGFTETLESLKRDLPASSGKGESSDPSLKSPATVDPMVIDLDDDDPAEANGPTPKTTIAEPIVNGLDKESPDPPPTPEAPVKDGVYGFIDRLFGDKKEITIKKKLFKKIIQTCFAERIQALSKTKAPPLQQAILAAQKCNQLQKSVFNFEGQREDTKVLLNKLIEDRRAKKTWDESLVPPRATRSVGLQVCINGKLFLKQSGSQNSTSSQMFSTELTTKDLSDEMQRKAGAQQRQTLSHRERPPVRKTIVGNAKKSTTSPHILPPTRLTNGTTQQMMTVTTAGPNSQVYTLSPTKSTFSIVKPASDVLSRVIGSPNTNSVRQTPTKIAPPPKHYQLTSATVVNTANPIPINVLRPVAPVVKTSPARPGPSLKTPNTSQTMTMVSTPTQTGVAVGKPQASASTTIDLTDDDAASAKPSTRTPSQTPVTSTGSARKSTSMRNSLPPSQFKPIRPKPPPKAVATPLKALQNGNSSQRSKTFPSLPPNPPNFNPSTAPPKPHLGICNTKTITQGIMLTWHFNGVAPTRKVTKFQVFAYQESKDVNQGMSDDAWKKVGDVNALPLPMACTLTQFREGFTYHFIVRAVDEVGEVGLFSTPNTITLMRKN